VLLQLEHLVHLAVDVLHQPHVLQLLVPVALRDLC
jgi:hypothetical protein